MADGEKLRQALEQRYAAVFTSPDGELVLRDIIVAGGLLEVASTAEAVWHDGRRSLALHILERLRFGEAQLINLARARAPQSEQALPRDASDIDDPLEDQ